MPLRAPPPSLSGSHFKGACGAPHVGRQPDPLARQGQHLPRHVGEELREYKEGGRRTRLRRRPPAHAEKLPSLGAIHNMWPRHVGEELRSTRVHTQGEKGVEWSEVKFRRPPKAECTL